MIIQTVAQSLLSSHPSPQPPVEQLISQLQPDFKVDAIAYTKTCSEIQGKPLDEERLRHAQRAHQMANLVEWIASQSSQIASGLPEMAAHEAEALAYWAKGATWWHLACYRDALDAYQKAAQIYTTQGQTLALLGLQALLPTLRDNEAHHTPPQTLASHAHLSFRVANLIQSFILQRGSAEPELKALRHWATEVGLQHLSPLGNSNLIDVQLALLDLLHHDDLRIGDIEFAPSPHRPIAPSQNLARCLAKLAQTLIPHLAEPLPKALAEWAAKIAQQHLSDDQETLESHQQSKIEHQKSNIKNQKLPAALIAVQAALAETLRTLSEHHAAQALSTKLQPHLSVDVIAYLKESVDTEKLRDAHLALNIADITQSLAPQIAEPEAEALACWAKGMALLHLVRYQEAKDYYQKAAEIYAEQGTPLALVGVQASMVAILRNLGNHQDALSLVKQVRESCLELGIPAQRYLANLEMNAGVVYYRLGNAEAALETFKRGSDIFAELGDEIEVARMNINRSIILQVISNFVKAQELLLEARCTFAQTEQHAQQIARVDFNLGMLAYRRGQYQEALTHFEAAHQGFTGIDTLIAKVDLCRSLIYHKLNMSKETIDLSLAAESIFEQKGMLEQQTLAVRQQGLGYQLAGDYHEAQKYLTKARELLQQEEVRSIMLELHYDLARLAYMTGQINDAQQLVLKLQEDIAPDTWPLLAAQAQLLLAQCAFIEEPDRACHYAEAALKLAEANSLRETTIAAHHLMAQIFESKGETNEAWWHYQKALQLVESLRVLLQVDQFHISFMDNKVPIYSNAVRLCQQTATPAQVLHILNFAHSPPLVFKGSATTPLETQLHSELAALREKWHWYQNKREEASHHEDATTVDQVKLKLKEVEVELTELYYRSQVHKTFVASNVRTEEGFEKLFGSDAANQFLASLQERLAPNEALLHYYLVNDTFQALLVNSNTIHLLPDLVSTKRLARVLRGWDMHLNNICLMTTPSEISSLLAQPEMRCLYQYLVAPLVPHLIPDTHLFVVMPPEWHHLPFAALFDGQRYLVERHQITYLSAPEVLLNRASTPALNTPVKGQALIIGHSNDGSYPGVLQGAKTVAQKLSAYCQTKLLLDKDATFDNFQRDSRESHLIHLSTHAEHADEKKGENPLFSWARLEGHRLTVADLYQMSLPQNPLVVLSACKTGRGQRRGNDLLGMGRALLAAGASGVVVTLWKVEDKMTAKLMIEFYNQLQSDQEMARTAAALRQAQQQAIARHLHPFFWAGFIFIQA